MLSGVEQAPAVDAAGAFSPVHLDRNERAIVADHLRTLGVGYAKEGRERLSASMLKESDRFRACGVDHYYFECPEDLHAFKVPCTCKSRICPECCKGYLRRFYRSIMDQVKQVAGRRRRGYTLSLLTLTVSSKRFKGGFPSRQDMQRFHAESQEFFSLFFSTYKGRISKKTGNVYPDRRRFRGAGFIAVTELGWRNNNLHLHAICYGPIVPIRTLRSEWERITGDSFGVHIEKMNKSKDAVHYVTKYISKPPGVDSYLSLAEYAAMIKGSRRIRTGGIFYNRIKAFMLERAAPTCPYCGATLRFSRCPEKLGSLQCIPDLSQFKDMQDGKTLEYPPWSHFWAGSSIS